MAIDAQEIADGIARDWLAEQLWLAKHAPEQSPAHTRRRYVTPSTFSVEDVLATIEPPAYVESLTGEDAPTGRAVCCPLPDHEDGTPSFYAYDDPERGWYCFGCNRGGSIYDLGAALWGLPTRGSGFTELRTRLALELLGRAA